MKSSALLLVATLSGAGAFAPPSATQRFVPTKSAIHALPDAVDLPIQAAASAVSSSAPGAAIDAVSQSGGGGPPVALLVTGLVGIAAVAGLTLFGGGSGLAEAPGKTKGSAEPAPEPEPIDVSIPYDAAAMLTYCQLKGTESIDDKADFEAFKAAYEEATVAEVTLKKMKRELAVLEKSTASKKDALQAFKAEP